MEHLYLARCLWELTPRSVRFPGRDLNGIDFTTIWEIVQACVPAIPQCPQPPQPEPPDERAPRSLSPRAKHPRREPAGKRLGYSRCNRRWDVARAQSKALSIGSGMANAVYENAGDRAHGGIRDALARARRTKQAMLTLCGWAQVGRFPALWAALLSATYRDAVSLPDEIEAADLHAA